MSNTSVLAKLGHAAKSVDGARASSGLHRPISVQTVLDAFCQDVVFDEPIVTADGIALAGHHRLVLHRDGGTRYSGHFRATGFPSFDVAIATILAYEVEAPDEHPPVRVNLVFSAHGRVHGTNEPGSNLFSWDMAKAEPLLAAEWAGVRRATITHNLQFDSDFFGSAGGVASFLGQVAALGLTLGGSGVLIVLAGELADAVDLEQLAVPGMVGVVLAGAAAFVFGPVALFPAFLVGAAVTASLVRQRHLAAHERDFADRVFKGRVPFDRIILTNLVGVGDRPFTAPGPGGAIIVNLGKGFDDPIHYTGAGGERTGIRAPGQLLIHELVHAWQIANESFTPEYYCRALWTAIGTVGSDKSAYSYGPAGGDWRTFGTEQQASIVDQWFAGKRYPPPGTDRPAERQSSFPPGLEADRPDDNPYFRYIRDNIRTGIS